VTEGYVRGDLHASYLVAPPRAKEHPSGGGAYFGKENEDEESVECMLTFIAQLDPKGWIWRSGGYQDQFLKEVSTIVLVVSND
jgi:hypothetical protein